MNRRIFGALGVMAVLGGFGACKDDPLSDLDGGAAALVTEFSYIEVAVAATVAVTATVLDERAAPLIADITFRTCNATVSIAPDTSYHPVPPTSERVLITGVTYGTSCVIAEGEGLVDTIQVATFPFSLEIIGPDSLGSGESTVYGYEYLDAAGNPVAGVEPPTFASADTLRVKLSPTPLGTAAAFSPGDVEITATGPGSSESGVIGTKTVTVVPGEFLGTVSPTSGAPTDTIKITNATGGPGFDADTRVFINDVRAFTFGVTPDSVKVIVPGMGAAGSVTISMQNMGPGQLAQDAPFTSTTASLADAYDAVNDDPGTAPEITANGDYYVILSGGCSSGVGGADCDDFFQVTNTGGADATITVNIAWFTDADIDGFGLDPTFDFCTFDGGCAAASTANPENFSMTVPAGETWFIYLNLWEAEGAASSLARVRVSGLP